VWATNCRKVTGWQSDLLRATNRGIATLYASDHVYWEVYEHLPKIARWSKVPVPVLQARFETNYLPRLRFVTVTLPPSRTRRYWQSPTPTMCRPASWPSWSRRVWSSRRIGNLRKPGLAP